MDEQDAFLIATRLNLHLTINCSDGTKLFGGIKGADEIQIEYRPGHYYAKKVGGSDIAPSQSLLNKLVPKLFDFRPDLAAAERLLKNIESGHVGYLLPRNESFLRKCRSLIACPPEHAYKKKIAALFGLPGTAKSYPWIQALRKLGNSDNDLFRFISFEVGLRDEISKAFNLKSGLGYRLPTWEVPFLQSHAPIMIIDDVGKFPPGYVSLLALLCAGTTHILVNGDPTQDTYHCEKSGNTINDATPEVDNIAKYCYEYKLNMVRPCCGVAHHLGLPHECNTRPGSINTNAQPSDNNPIVTATQQSCATYTAIGRRAYTFSGSQGITFNSAYEIHTDKYAKLATDRAWFTALTRGRFSINIVRGDNTRSGFGYSSSIARALFTNNPNTIKQAVLAHIRKHVPGRLLDPNKLLGGSTDVTEVTRLLPHLSGLLNETTRVAAPDANYPIVDAGPNPDLPRPDIRSVQHQLSNATEILRQLVGVAIQEVKRDKNLRERLVGELQTDQVDDTNELTGLFLRHKRADEATTKWSLDERIVRPDWRNQKNHASLGHILFNQYVKTYRPVPRDFNLTRWEEAEYEDQDRFLSKGLKQLAAISDRACPDWLLNRAELFLKGQSVTKPGTIGRDAKKGQIIISFCTELNILLGTMAKYMAREVADSLPDHIFSMDKNTDADLSTFARQFDYSRDSSEDDYEGFDQSQGPEFQVFDADLMRFHHIPEFYVEFYLDFVVDIHTFLTILGPMLATGYKFTLDFNSNRSRAYQATKYIIRFGTPMATVGDDVAINDTPPVAPMWQYLEHQFRLKSKRAVKRYPTFCGWIMNPIACFKDPELLLHRTVYQCARGNLPNCILSYMADITPLNQNLEMLSAYLTEEQLEQHAITVDLLNAEAKATGIKNFGKFTERYGQTRSYDIKCLGGIQLKPSEHLEMPYTYLNYEYVAQLANANWVSTRELRGLCMALMPTDFSVVDSRREAHKALNDFTRRFLSGENLFDDEKRFPRGFTHTYVTTADTRIQDLFVALSVVLSYRSTNVAKDTEVGSQTGKASTDKAVALALDQGNQDNVKRFEELVKSLCSLANSDYTWNRNKFERYAVWYEGNEPPQTGVRAAPPDITVTAAK